MEFKVFPYTEWRVESEYRKEYILQMVEQTKSGQLWRSSLYNTDNDFPARGVVSEDGFTINFSDIKKKSRSSLQVPLRVKMRKDGNMTVLECMVGLSAGRFLGIILWYVFLGVLGYVMGFRMHDIEGELVPLVTGGVHYLLVMILFNRAMLIYKSYVKQLTEEGRR